MSCACAKGGAGAAARLNEGNDVKVWRQLVQLQCAHRLQAKVVGRYLGKQLVFATKLRAQNVDGAVGRACLALGVAHLRGAQFK